jgi:hypothetical protein
MPHNHTHQDPDQRSRPAVESVARNAHGQSLDDVRETFRAEWQAKIERKREQATEAASAALFFHHASQVILGGAAALGVLFGCLSGFQQGGLSTALTTSVTAALIAVLLALLPAGAAFGCAWLLCTRAERLEQEAQELERS